MDHRCLGNHSFIIHLSFWTNGSSEKQIGYFKLLLLIPVLTTASQRLLWLWRLYFFSILQLFPPSCDLQHKGYFRLKLLIKFPNWKLSISSSTHLFFLLIWQEATELYNLNSHFCINGNIICPHVIKEYVMKLKKYIMKSTPKRVNIGSYV